MLFPIRYPLGRSNRISDGMGETLPETFHEKAANKVPCINLNIKNKQGLRSEISRAVMVIVAPKVPRFELESRTSFSDSNRLVVSERFESIINQSMISQSIINQSIINQSTNQDGWARAQGPGPDPRAQGAGAQGPVWGPGPRARYGAPGPCALGPGPVRGPNHLD